MSETSRPQPIGPELGQGPNLVVLDVLSGGHTAQLDIAQQQDAPASPTSVVDSLNGARTSQQSDTSTPPTRSEIVRAERAARILDEYPEGWSQARVKEMVQSPSFLQLMSEQRPEEYEQYSQALRKYERDIDAQITEQNRAEQRSREHAQAAGSSQSDNEGRSPTRSEIVRAERAERAARILDEYPEGWSQARVKEMVQSPSFLQLMSEQRPEEYEQYSQALRKYERDMATGKSPTETPIIDDAPVEPDNVVEVKRPESIPEGAWSSMTPEEQQEAVRLVRVVDDFDRNDNPTQAPSQANRNGGGVVMLAGGAAGPADIPRFYGPVQEAYPGEPRQLDDAARVTDPTPTPAGGVTLPQQPNGEAPTSGAPEAVAVVAGEQPGDAATVPITIEPAPKVPEPTAHPEWDPGKFAELMNSKAHKPEAAAPDATTTQVLPTVDSAGGLAKLAELMDEQQQGPEGSRKRLRMGRTAPAIAALLFAGSGIAAVANLWGGPDGNSDKVSVSDQVSGVSNPAPAPSSKAPRHRA